QGIVYESEVLTEAAREEAARAVKPVYKLDPDVLTELAGDVRAVFTEVRRVRGLEETPEEEKLVLLEEAGIDLPEGNLLALLHTEAENIDNLERDLIALLNDAFSKGVQEGAVAETREQLLERALELEGVPDNLRPVGAVILEGLDLRPNFFIDQVLTAQQRQQAREAVAPVQVRIRQNE